MRTVATGLAASLLLAACNANAPDFLGSVQGSQAAQGFVAVIGGVVASEGLTYHVGPACDEIGGDATHMACRATASNGEVIELTATNADAGNEEEIEATRVEISFGGKQVFKGNLTEALAKYAPAGGGP